MVASNDIQSAPASGARTERYRRAERAFWDHHGLAPAERFVTVGSPPVRLRVQELGSGGPVLFVNGTRGPGAYFDALGIDRACLVGGSIGSLWRCGWPRRTPRGWTAWSCWAAGP
jgi:hypothetical protein